MRDALDLTYPPEYERESFVHDALSVAGSDEAAGAMLEAFFDRKIGEGPGGLSRASDIISTALVNACAAYARRLEKRDDPAPF